MALQEEMLSLVLKDLPNQTAGVLKSYLDEAEKNKKEVESLKAQKAQLQAAYDDQSKKLAHSMSELSILGAKLKSQADLDMQQARLERGERDLQLTLATEQVSSAQKVTNAVMELARAAFRNPVFKRVEEERIPLVVPGSNGYGSHIQSETKTKTTTNETE